MTRRATRIGNGTGPSAAEIGRTPDVYIAREVLCKARGDDTCYVKLVKKDWGRSLTAPFSPSRRASP
jgi:hypothetical protein